MKHRGNNKLSSQIAVESIDKIFSESPATTVIDKDLSHQETRQLEHLNLPELIVKPESFEIHYQGNPNAQES